jgi:hypothetical protein
MTATSRRQPPTENPDTIANQSWEAARYPISRWLKWAKAYFSSIPGGFSSTTPTTVTIGGTASAGTEAASWMAADAQLVVAAATPSNPTGPAALPGSATTGLRSDCTVQQGIVTTKGDILGYSSVAARVPVGADGTYLTADSAQTLGIKWAALSPSVEELELLAWIL